MTILKNSGVNVILDINYGDDTVPVNSISQHIKVLLYNYFEDI